MTPSTLAETILRDVKRYSLNMLAIEMYETPHGGWVKLPAVESALSRALDPALSERAGEVLPRLRKADEYEPLGHDGWEAADLITALLTANAAQAAQIAEKERTYDDLYADALSERAGEVLEGVSDAPWRVGHLESYEMSGLAFRRVYFPTASEGEIHEAHIRGEDCDENARFIAWCREGVPALLAQNAALRAERDEALEWLSASQGYIADAVFALDKQEKAEAKVEKLRGAIRNLKREWYLRDLQSNDFDAALTSEADNG